MNDPQKDDHIEELLGKLQGIFGKLSHTEEEEAKQKIEIPTPAPKEPVLKKSTEPAAPPEAPASSATAAPIPLNLYSEPPPVAASPVSPAAAPTPSTTGTYESTISYVDPDKVTVPTAVFYPPGRETEAKSLAQKLETMTPKFTKVAFRLQVGVFMPYEPKSDWKDIIVTKAAEAHFQTAFVVMDRPLEDSKRKAIAAGLEERNIYFQEVPTATIEKKAFYTDILLGLVFFFDSRKPPTPRKGNNGGFMNTAKIKTHLPTISKYIEKRKKAKQNRLPKHLRPPEIWPLWIQLAINTGLIIALFNLMVDRDDFITEAGPAIALVVCFLLLIYTLISAVRLRRFHDKIRGQRLAKLNLGLMIIAFLLWTGSIVVFLP